ncbi:MAG: C40 family peptidase [Marmoricola sp.]
MRRSVRGALAVAVALTAVAGVTTAADADRGKPVPSQQQVDQANALVTQKAGDVAAIQAALVVANSRLQQAADAAEVAAEAYNGALWRQQQAVAAAVKAKAASKAAGEKVEEQRSGIAALATQTYQDGTALSGVTALIGSGGPEDVMNRVNVVQSAATSMQAQFDEYAASSALAKVARAQADKAQARQTELTRKASLMRDRAAAAARAAQSQASAIATQRHQLIGELAAAQKISVALATQRQRGLEQAAEIKAAKDAQAKAKAQAAAAAEAAANGGDGGGGGGYSGPGLTVPAGTSAGAARAIRFAEAQLGEMYLWAAAGPDRWDCSGLTMMAWRAGGVSLPHYSAAQYSETKHLGVEDLRPGDLVFWGDSPGTIHHVAMYIGNGRIIHAPRTGRPVEIDSMYYWIPPNYFGRP